MKNPVNSRSTMSRTAKFAKLTSAIALSLSLVALSATSRAADPEVKIDASTAVEIKKEINGLPAGSKVTSTAGYEDYALAPVVDGIKKRKDLGWQEGSWASAEDETVHGIEIHLAKPQRGGRFQVSWGYDIHNEENGKWWVSRDYVVQIKEKAGDAWKTVVAVKGNQSVIGSYSLPDVAFGFVRIYQLPGGGHADRPNIMWVGQIEIAD